MNPNKIKPCLLFEDADEGLEAVEEEPEDDEVDEEAETDIDEASQGSQSSAIIVTSSKKGVAGHCAKRWWVYLIGVCVLVAVIIPIM